MKINQEKVWISRLLEIGQITSTSRFGKLQQKSEIKFEQSFSEVSESGTYLTLQGQEAVEALIQVVSAEKSTETLQHRGSVQSIQTRVILDSSKWKRRSAVMGKLFQAFLVESAGMPQKAGNLRILGLVGHPITSIVQVLRILGQQVDKLVQRIVWFILW